LTNASLPKGSYVKLQPHSKDFLDISNPRAVLETTLRGFSCLTVGDTIPIHYNEKVYQINIIDAKPSDAISVIETDCNVDFAAPLDYVEEEHIQVPPSSASSQGPSGKEEESQQVVEEAQEPGFVAFQGSGRRLDGKPVTAAAPPPVAQPPRPAAAEMKKKKSGKLMFKDRLAAKFSDTTSGGRPGSSSVEKPASAESQDGTNKQENSSFKAFQGKGYRLC